jgi:hypothetical protein
VAFEAAANHSIGLPHGTLPRASEEANHHLRPCPIFETCRAVFSKSTIFYVEAIEGYRSCHIVGEVEFRQKVGKVSDFATGVGEKFNNRGRRG